VRATLTSSLSPTGGVNSQNAEQTIAPYNSANDTYGTGKILIGTLNIVVGNGTTTFRTEPASAANLTVPAGTTFFNTLANSGSSGNGTNPGATTPLSGSSALPATVLAANMFPNTTGGSTVVNLDQSYTSTTRSGSTSYDTFNSLQSTAATAGPDAKPASTSFLPFYTASGTVSVFTVTSVPEPGSLALCGFAVAFGAGWVARRRKRAA
jgi:hypothetical protein